MSTESGRSHWIPRTAVEIQVAYYDGSIRGQSAGSLASRRMSVNPDQWTCTLNDHRKPDEFQLEFSFRDAPLDPDIIRSMAVFIHLGTVARIDDRIPGDETDLLLVGHADEIEQSWSDRGQVISVKGRDQTALFLDSTWPRGKTVPLGRPVDAVIRDILSMRVAAGTEDGDASGFAFPAVKDFKVIWDGVGESVGKAFVSRREVARSSGGSSAPSTAGRKRKRRDIDGAFTEANLWDVLYRIALHAGVVLEVRNVEGEATLVLRPPETLAPAEVEDDEYVFIYGRDLEYLRVRREFGRVTVPNIRVRCVIDGKLRVATWPSPSVYTDWNSDGRPSEKRFENFNVSGFKSVKALRDLAKVIWFQMGRKETSFRFGTKDLESFNSRDLTKIRSGAQTRLLVDPEDTRYFGNLSRGQREARLRAVGYADQVASELARVWDLVNERPRVYFLDEARIKWSNSRAFQLEGSAINFLGAPTE